MRIIESLRLEKISKVISFICPPTAIIKNYLFCSPSFFYTTFLLSEVFFIFFLILARVSLPFMVRRPSLTIELDKNSESYCLFQLKWETRDMSSFSLSQPYYTKGGWRHSLVESIRDTQSAHNISLYVSALLASLGRQTTQLSACRHTWMEPRNISIGNG